MDLPEKYFPGMVQIAEDLDNHHSHLRVALSTNHAPYEALTATLNCVRGLTGRVLLPTTNPVRRARLRKMALENRKLSNDPIHFSSSLPIRTTGKLTLEDLSQPASPNRCTLLKQKLQYANTPPLRDPYVLGPRYLCAENNLPVVLGNIVDTAVDWEPGLPECWFQGIQMLWDTSAANTYHIGPPR
ncbi:hypothetical protein N7491_001786 [Penicillium cf. griseofulvum]|uniref:Uncharacterized protein n=1 Tax=Penicillium cf. griseofulvum TaxID=2972120 RepID=A0A9W9JCU9_9EURO|nr:hypothetical protein N7472_006914 [Penicillium cf. griseofulvum]KAJ5445704.1 hypothetical protein N7491_001786 [Penicillium cf. griseofulvum]KAJ5447426.1 hypothetical protein N7445_002247 [Penicillium cf. griseofulvum]